MASSWLKSWGESWGNSWGILGVVHPSHDKPPPFRGNPFSVYDELRRGRIINRLVLIQLAIWRDEFLEFVPGYLARAAPWMLDDMGRLSKFAHERVHRRIEELETEWFERINSGGATIEEMRAMPNPYIESYREDVAALSSALSATRH